MGFNTWVEETGRRIRSDGLAGVRESAYWLYVGAVGRLSFLRPGVSVYERDWDMLVLLDGCRCDTLAQVADEYDFLAEMERHPSVGSTSAEWLANTFDGTHADEVSRTSYVTGNIYTDGLLSDDQFDELVEVWRTDWDDELGTVRPRRVTDAAIRTARESERERIIVHYMQPHYPFLEHPDLAPGMRSEDASGNVWTQLRRGELTQEAVLEAYRENLRDVLDEVSMLLSNVDAPKTIISADHGNAFGEWGIYGHPGGVPVSCVREVPWARTSATDESTYEPEPRAAVNESDQSVEEKLAALGYIDSSSNS